MLLLANQHAAAELKALAVSKAEGASIDREAVDSLLDDAGWDRSKWLDLVRKGSARRKASEMLASLEKQETIDLSDTAAGRETLRAKCQAKFDELQTKIDALEAEKREAIAPLAAFDRQLADMHGRNQRVAIAAERSIAEMKQLLESTADKSIDVEIAQLTVEQQRLQRGLCTIIRPRTSQTEALRLKEELAIQPAASLVAGEAASDHRTQTAQIGRILWQHEEADREQFELKEQLAKVERQLEKANAAKLDWKNFSAE
jgi:hypothetical protein